jgi:hypothetical protein
VDVDQVRQAAKDAAIYGFPSVIQYRTMWLQVLDANSASYVGFGRWLVCGLPGPEDKDIVGASRDTPYLYAWLDLRAEPWVLTVPAISPEGRYYTSQWDDMNGIVIGNVSALSDGYEGGDYLIAGPDWEGESPAGIKGVLRSETYIAASITRVEVMGEDDMDAVRAIQLGFGLQPLSQHLGTPQPPATPPLDYPPYREGLYQSASPEFFDLVAFLLQFSQPDPMDQPILERMAGIGLIPGQSWTLGFGADPAHRKAAVAGLGDAIDLMNQIQSGKADIGSRATNPLYGTRHTLATHYVHRAFGAWTGIFGNVVEQAAYRGWRADSDGGAINAGKHNYKATFTADDQSQVRFFWSVTMYLLPEPYLYANPQNKYAITGRAPDLVRNSDGSVTLYLQHDSPGEDLEPNWLPAPAGPFLAGLRLYGPSDRVQSDQWHMPDLRKAD